MRHLKRGCLSTKGDTTDATKTLKVLVDFFLARRLGRILRVVGAVDDRYVHDVSG